MKGQGHSHPARKSHGNPSACNEPPYTHALHRAHWRRLPTNIPANLASPKYAAKTPRRKLESSNPSITVPIVKKEETVSGVEPLSSNDVPLMMSLASFTSDKALATLTLHADPQILFSEQNA